MTHYGTLVLNVKVCYVNKFTESLHQDVIHALSTRLDHVGLCSALFVKPCVINPIKTIRKANDLCPIFEINFLKSLKLGQSLIYNRNLDSPAQLEMGKNLTFSSIIVVRLTNP